MKNLQGLRQYHRLTEAQLGAMLGVSARDIALFERGVHDPTESQMQQLAEFFDVPPSFLAGDNGCRWEPDAKDIWEDIESTWHDDRDFVALVESLGGIDYSVAPRYFQAKERLSKAGAPHAEK